MIVNLVIALLLVGVALYLVNNYVPMERSIRALLNVVVFVVMLLWVLEVFGLFHLGTIRL